MWSGVALLFLGCATTAPDASPDRLPQATPPEEKADLYGAAMQALEADRVAFATRERTPALRQAARTRLTQAIRQELIPHWVGTPWTFEGATQVPGEGTIACGYFVSTVLEDAALKVERKKMAQQMSEYIVLTFTEPAHVRRFRDGEVDAVVAALEKEPPGVYIVGLDFHTGFVIRTQDQVEFCHSSWVDAAGVACNDPRTDPAFASEYHVYGAVLEDEVITRWLDGEDFATYLKGG